MAKPSPIDGAEPEAAAIERELERLLAAGPVDVHENGELMAELAGFQYQAKQQGRNTVLHLWSEERNLVRRVLRVIEQSEDQLGLEVQRFGRKPGRLEFVCAGASRTTGRLTRERFRARFRQLLAEQFPDESIETLTAAPDLEHSFSGCYVRGVLARGQQAWTVIGVSSAENAAIVDAILSFGLLWLDWTRERAGKWVIAGLRLFVPEGCGRVPAYRLRALSPAVKVELYEMNEADWKAQQLDAQDAGNVATWLTPWREVEQTLDSAREVIEKVSALADAGAIDALVPPGTREVALRLRGLEFARWQNGKVFCGLPDERREWNGKWDVLKRLVKRIDLHRHAAATDVNHSLYRAQAERWLETMVLADPARVDAHLDPGYIYTQVPAFSAGDRGVLDMLGATREGRLAVLELKASEDIHLALQAADYWLRVRQHQLEGEFQRYGYFAGKELQSKPPLLYLVAPGFRFHTATEVILKYLSPEIEVVRVGLNEGWRRGVKVVFRQ